MKLSVSERNECPKSKIDSHNLTIYWVCCDIMYIREGERDLLIQQNKVLNIEKHLVSVKSGEKFYIGITDVSTFESQLRRIGFTEKIEVGERVLPAVVGSVSRFNAEGRFVPIKNLPKEKYSIEREWSWKDWGGNEHSKIVDVIRERYQREFIPPPSIELEITTTANLGKMVVSDLMVYNDSNLELIKHTVNLFLELFKECHLLTENLLPSVKPTVRRLNWTILPEGKYPWTRLSPYINPILTRVKKGNQPVIKNRFEKITSQGPDFVALGEAGFRGYVVFGFIDKNLFILESSQLDNATYVFESNWEQLSKMTKAQILNNKLEKERIIHIKGWETKLINLLQ